MRRLNAVRNRKEALKVVKEFDAFPKVPDTYQERTVSGGGISILVFGLILILVVSEINYYTDSELKFDVEVDKNITGSVKINIDMTIAMTCESVGADVLDQTGTDVSSFGELSEEPVHFNLSPSQQRHLGLVQRVNQYLRDEYHAIHDLLWRGDSRPFGAGMPPRDDNPTTPPDACRFHGTLELHKVAGNFHVTAGKSVPVFPRGHAHLALMLSEKDYNFSHRIDHFSFGDSVAGVVYPLDGSMMVTNSNMHVFQYFIQVVPTEVRTFRTYTNTYQFAVTERNRSIDHNKGSHGVPGIFFKYDLSPLMIRVREVHAPIWQFLVRLCGIVGGIFSVSGILHNVVGFLVDVVCCRYKLGKHKPLSFDDVSSRSSSEEPASLMEFPPQPPLQSPLLATT